MPITAIRGFNDILPAEALFWRRIEETAWRVFSSYGFSEIKLPVAEKTALFSRSIGEATDIVEKEMYTFSDRSGESVTLRPEGTASVVRAYIEHKLYVAPVTRLYYTAPCSGTKGRKRAGIASSTRWAQRCLARKVHWPTPRPSQC